MTDAMFVKWLERRPVPAFKLFFGYKKIIVTLDMASYHRGFDVEIRVPETDRKINYILLLCKFGVQSITVKRK